MDPARCLGLVSESPCGLSDWLFRRAGNHVTISPKGTQNFNTSDALLEAARRGAGLIYVLAIFVKQHIATGRLVQLHEDGSTSERIFYAVTAKTQYMLAKVRAFIGLTDGSTQRAATAQCAPAG